MSSTNNLPYKQAANVERRTWDKEAYEARARARNEAVALASAGGSGGGGPGAAVGSKRPMGNEAIQTATDAAAAAMSDEREKEEFVPASQGAAGPEKSQGAYLKSRRN